MKKWLIGMSLLVVLSLAGGIVAVAQGPDGRPACGHRFGGGRGAGSPMGVIGTLADLAGVDVSEIRSALEEGQTLAEVAQSYGVDPDALLEAALEEKTDRLEQAVEDGRLTQEQADAILEQAREHLAQVIEGSLPAFPRNFHRPGLGNGVPRGPRGGK